LGIAVTKSLGLITLVCALLTPFVPEALAVPLHDERSARRVDSLFELIEARLQLMNDVAAYKYRHKLGIEDIAREQVILDKAEIKALAFGLTPTSSRFFFALQIEAAKEIQHYWFDEWTNGAPLPSNAVSLKDELRPRIQTLGDAILTAIAETYPITDKSLATQFVRSINVEGLSDATKFALFRALFEVEKFTNELDQIIATGILRVATTGDYAPFSETIDGVTRGIDIILADDLAASLGVKVQLVKTSWPTLMDDLQAGAFDIAMSGISRSLDRQQQGFFSQPYHTGGKTPIARCEQAAQFDSLAQIDQQGVRVIVNPGGTNERFTTTNISRASVTLFADNRSIFNEIAEGRADVMITDAIEVKLQAALDPRLCASMQGKTLTYQQKAYLLPRDIIWKEYVDTWLSLRINDGTVAKVFAEQLQ
jgi:cyclohexadienyl dehydratase